MKEIFDTVADTADNTQGPRGTSEIYEKIDFLPLISSFFAGIRIEDIYLK